MIISFCLKWVFLIELGGLRGRERQRDVLRNLGFYGYSLTVRVLSSTQRTVSEHIQRTPSEARTSLLPFRKFVKCPYWCLDGESAHPSKQPTPLGDVWPQE
jgi:hypothetical protein